MKLVSGKNVVRTTTLAALLIGGGLLANAQQTNDQPVPADNTKVNQRATAVPTSPPRISKKMNPSDRDITQQIRKSIVADKSLSTYAITSKSSPKTAWSRSKARCARKKTRKP